MGAGAGRPGPIFPRLRPWAFRAARPPDSAPALNSNGARRPRNGAKMADWAPPDWLEAKPSKRPGTVYGRGLRAFMLLPIVWI